MSDFSHLPPVGYEKQDVDTGAAHRTSLVITALTLLSVAVSWGYFGWLHGADRAARQAAARPVVHPRERVPPEPRLQRQPFDDVVTLRAEEGDLLASYAFVDAQAGVTRIPIDEAMRLYVERAAAGRAAQPFAPPAAPGPAPEARP